MAVWLMPYRILCNAVKRVDVKASLDLTSELFCHVPLHKIRYGIQAKPAHDYLLTSMLELNTENVDEPFNSVIYRNGVSGHFCCC